MILRKIKRLLGMGSGPDETGRSERDVVVQEESSNADAGTEAAVTGVDDGSVDDSNAVDDDIDEPVATGTDASASTESLVDEAEAQDDPESRAEPAEAAGTGTDEETDATDVEDIEEETDTTDEEDTADDATEEADADTDPEEGTDVDEIKGIGPAYSDRLGEVGIHNVSQLAAANASDLAERVSVAEGTVRKWIDRAQESEN